MHIRARIRATDTSCMESHSNRPLSVLPKFRLPHLCHSRVSRRDITAKANRSETLQCKWKPHSLHIIAPFERTITHSSRNMQAQSHTAGFDEYLDLDLVQECGTWSFLSHHNRGSALFLDLGHLSFHPLQHVCKPVVTPQVQLQVVLGVVHEHPGLVA